MRLDRSFRAAQTSARAPDATRLFAAGCLPPADSRARQRRSRFARDVALTIASL